MWNYNRLASLLKFFVPNGQLFAEYFGVEISTAVREMFVRFSHSAKAQIQQRQVNADHDYICQVADIPQRVKVEACDIRRHAKGQYQ